MDNFDPNQIIDTADQLAHPESRPSVLFTQAIANPVDVMSSIAYLLAGGVCERFPDAKFIFLEANGGWLVPWLERLDHHCRKFQWEVTDLSMLPSEYMRRQCWISFDPDEAMLGITAESPLVGADRIIWASDYPHPDAKFPGCDRRARGGPGRSFLRTEAPDHVGECHRPLWSWMTARRRGTAASHGDHSPAESGPTRRICPRVDAAKHRYGTTPSLLQPVGRAATESACALGGSRVSRHHRRQNVAARRR